MDTGKIATHGKVQQQETLLAKTITAAHIIEYLHLEAGSGIWVCLDIDMSDIRACRGRV